MCGQVGLCADLCYRCWQRPEVNTKLSLCGPEDWQVGQHSHANGLIDNGEGPCVKALCCSLHPDFQWTGSGLMVERPHSHLQQLDLDECAA